MTGRVWRLDLPLRTPLSMNDREHRMVRHRRVAQVRSDAKLLAKAAKIPKLERISVELHYCPRDSRRRDPLNLVATLKPLEDGIVDAGVIPDDTPVWSLPTMPIIDLPDSTPGTVRLYAIVRELEPFEVLT
jgi:crossover junction endodeoxyribonuclease RusA